MSVAAKSPAYFLDSSCLIQSLLRCISLRKDSISDGLRRAMGGKVSDFGFCERVEAIAGDDLDGLFDIAESFTDLA